VRVRSRLAVVGVGVALAVAAAPASASVLDIGDSLTVGSEATLKQIVPGIQIDAETGRPSSVGLANLSREYNGQNVVVFDLGTNDGPSPGPFIATLEQVRKIIGHACLVVSTINRPPVGGVSYAGMNRAIENFAFRDGNTQVVPWKLYTRLHPEVVFSDGVHVTPYGYVFRAHVLATAINSCPGGAAEVPSGGESQLPPPSSGPTASSPPTPKPSGPPLTRKRLVRLAESWLAGVVAKGGEALAALAASIS
jgi:hypothetical protein